MSREGNIFCDIQQEDVGYWDNCYDRNDTPDQYCDKYAVEESEPEYMKEFCQSVCNNYEAVLARSEPYDNKVENN